MIRLYDEPDNPPRKKYFVESKQQHVVCIEVHYMSNEIRKMCEWLDENVNISWSSKVTAFDMGMVSYQFSFSDISTATLFRLKF